MYGLSVHPLPTFEEHGPIVCRVGPVGQGIPFCIVVGDVCGYGRLLQAVTGVETSDSELAWDPITTQESCDGPNACDNGRRDEHIMDYIGGPRVDMSNDFFDCRQRVHDETKKKCISVVSEKANAIR